jgi:hypothetical protein
MSRIATFITLALVCLFGLVQADTIYFGICSCFTPQYDASCCIIAGGTMSGNVCDTGDENATVAAYQQCCSTSGGTSKCKTGSRLDGIRPYFPGQYNCSSYPTLP